MLKKLAEKEVRWDKVCKCDYQQNACFSRGASEIYYKMIRH